jgi:hypothetical protein
MKPLNSESAQSTVSGPVNDRIRAGRGVGAGAGSAVGADVGGGAGELAGDAAGEPAGDAAGEPAGEDVGAAGDGLEGDGDGNAVGAPEDDGWPPIPRTRLSRIAASTPMPATMAVAFIRRGSSSAGIEPLLAA